LIEVFTFVNNGYTTDSDMFSKYDEGWQKKKFTRRREIDIREFVFGNRLNCQTEVST